MEAFIKSSVAEATRNKLKKILYEDILNSEDIDQVRVIKDLSILEKEIYDTIRSGKKDYYKPVKVKSQSAYENPMRIQGIKASVAYNALHEPGTEAIDLTIRNSLDIIKTEINHRTVEKIRDEYPDVYNKVLELLKLEAYKDGIDSIALPINEPVPGWVKPFIRYAEIINDNLANFPLESIGVFRGGDNNNKTNLIKF